MILEVNNIHTFYGISHILFKICLNVQEGETVSLLGRNGAGKTTIMRSIMGMTVPRSGTIKFLNRDITDLPTHIISRLGLGIVPEDRKIFEDLTVRENLQVPFTKSKGGINIENVYEIFPILKRLEKRLGGNISGGEQQMLTIARTLIANPKLLLMDEPAEGLSPIVVSLLAEAIRRLKREKLTILLSEQNVKFAMKLSDRAYIIEKGQNRFDGRIDEIEENSELRSKYLGI